ncbi:MAG: diguanylate cyclase [Chloroflexi bacterium]|nr:sugar transferase [Anaerolineaceae bacterium]NMB87611.1 diguanylate cyclase [Chloroflexota bacterium]
MNPAQGYLNPAAIAGSFSFRMVIKKWAKRIFDVVASLLGLIVLLPFFGFFAILIKRDSPGPTFYWGPRMGKNGRLFKILKFRTMYERPESYQGPRITSKGDQRITPLGQWLRTTKINELPQLWNVLIGEMSLVGPRPEDPDVAQKWPEDGSREILSVQPGITSPASILYHDEEELLSRQNIMGQYLQDILPNKLRLDRLYVRHHGFFSDLDVIFWTLAILIPKLARTRIPEGYIFAGPFSRLVDRYLNWFLMDTIVAGLSVAASVFLWRSVGPLNWGFPYLSILAIGIAFLFSSLNSVLGLNRIIWSRATNEDATGIFLSSGIVTILILALNEVQAIYHWVPLPPLSTLMIVTVGLIAPLGFVLTRYRLRLVTAVATRWLNWRKDAQEVGERVLIVGTGEGCDLACWLLKGGIFQYAFSICGIVDDDAPNKHGMRLDGHWVLGSTRDLPDLIKNHDIGTVFMANHGLAPDASDYVFDRCKEAGVRLIFLDELLNILNRGLVQPVATIEPSQWFNQYIEFRATHDPLTGLPNQYLFQEHLRQSLACAKRYQRYPIVMTVSLDQLRLGEIGGPAFQREALQEVACRLVKNKRESDILARTGEYEFALILENISDEWTAKMVAKRILYMTAESFQIDGKDIPLGARIGLLSTPEDAKTPDLSSSIEYNAFLSTQRLIEI